MSNGDDDLQSGVVQKPAAQRPVAGDDLSSGIVKTPAAGSAATRTAAPPAVDPNQSPQAVAARHARANVGRDVPTPADIFRARNEAPDLKEAGWALTKGGVEFFKDLIDPKVPTGQLTGNPLKDEAIRWQYLAKKYVLDPFDEQQAKAAQAGPNDPAGVMAHAIGAAVPFAGPMAGTAFDNWRKAHTLSQYAGAGLYGIAAILAARGMHEDIAGRLGPADITTGDVSEAITKGKGVETGAHAVLEKSARTAQAQLTTTAAKVGTKVGELVSKIQDKDVEILSQTGEPGSIDVAQAYDALVDAESKYNPEEFPRAKVKQVFKGLRKNMPGMPEEVPEGGEGVMPSALDAAAEELGDENVPPKVDFETAKGIRTSIGAMMKKVGGREGASLTAVYNDLTKQMADRSGDIGMAPEFDAYNTLHEKMADHLDGILGDLFKAETGLQFFDTIRKPSNGPRLAVLTKDLGDFGLADSFFEDLKNSHKATYRVARNVEKAGDAGAAFGGKMRAFGAHPIGAGAAAMVMSQISAMAPIIGLGGRFVMTLLAASKTADMLDRAAAAAEIRSRGGVPPVEGTFGNAAQVGGPPGGTPTPPAPGPPPSAAARAGRAVGEMFGTRPRAREPIVTPPPAGQAPGIVSRLEAKIARRSAGGQSAGGAGAAVQAAGSGIVSGMYEMLARKLAAGDTTEGGKPSPFLQAAKSAGIDATPEALRKFAEEGTRKPAGERRAAPAGERRFSSRTREEAATKSSTVEQQVQALEDENRRLEENLKTERRAEGRQKTRERLRQNRQMINELQDKEYEGEDFE